MSNKSVVIFDLDDTLYYEIDYLKSAYKEISKLLCKEVSVDYYVIYKEMLEFYDEGLDVFKSVIKKYCSSFKKEDLLNIYRIHKPNLKLPQDRIDVLNKLKTEHVNMGLLTDGRGHQQRNKIHALQLNNWFSEIIISEEFGSEKPNVKNYKYFEDVFGKGHFFYVGDNLNKDFVTPNSMGWTTICMKDRGVNIHRQNREKVPSLNYLPHYTINYFNSIVDLI